MTERFRIHTEVEKVSRQSREQQAQARYLTRAELRTLDHQTMILLVSVEDRNRDVRRGEDAGRHERNGKEPCPQCSQSVLYQIRAIMVSDDRDTRNLASERQAGERERTGEMRACSCATAVPLWRC
jgi:hypothetical protein